MQMQHRRDYTVKIHTGHEYNGQLALQDHVTAGGQGPPNHQRKCMQSADSTAQNQLWFVSATIGGTHTFAAMLWRIIFVHKTLCESILGYQMTEVSQKPWLLALCMCTLVTNGHRGMKPVPAAVQAALPVAKCVLD